MRSSHLRTYLASCLCLLILVGSALAAKPESSARPTPKSVAFLCQRPVCTGWNPLSVREGFRYAAGVILKESIAETPGFDLLPWKNTTGVRELVDEGLYTFPEEASYTEWGKLLAADAYLVADLNDQGFQYVVYTARRVVRGSVVEPLEKPKAAIASMVKDLYRAADVDMSPVVRKRVDDPETSKPELFLLWARWDSFVPNMYSRRGYNIWLKPSQAAARIVKEDRGFKRGMAWAMPTLLKPVDAGDKPGKKRPANPALFDMNVLHALDSRFAPAVFPHYNKRVREDKFLFQKSLDVLSVKGHTLNAEMDELDVAGDERVDLGSETGMSDEMYEEAATTPLIRSNVCLALSGVQNPKLIERLADLVTADPNADVRSAAAESLGGFEAEPFIINALERATDDADPAVRLAAYRSLAGLGRSASTAFRAGLGDADAGVKWYVQSTLIDSLDETKAAQEIVQRVLDSDDPSMRRYALERAGELFENIKPLESAVDRAFRAGHGPEQLAALDLMEHFNDQDAAEKLIPLLDAPAPEVRARAFALYIKFQPGDMGRAVGALRGDDTEPVQLALLNAIRQHGGKEYLDLTRSCLDSPWASVRALASNVVYKLCSDDREILARGMLADPSMRVNFAGLRVVARMQTPGLLKLLPDIVRNHPNEHVRARALRWLDDMDDPRAHDEAVRALRSRYFIVRLFAASILSRRAEPGDSESIRGALEIGGHPWLTFALQDALARSRNEPPPERVRLNLGEREYTEGGEIANGIQLWLGNRPDDPEETRELVDRGYRFGSVLHAPEDRAMGRMRTWNDSKGRRNSYLLHALESMRETDARFLHYYCLFDEPHTPGGGDRQDMRRAFLLEVGRPDLLGGKEIPAELRDQWGYFRSRTLTELSNWVVGVVRNTMQRKYQDIKVFPQTLSYMGGAAAECWHLLDADGDYSWRYDYHNLLGHYGKAAVMRAIKPGLPTYMVARIGTYRPNFFNLDTVYTSTDFEPGPWTLRNGLATRAGLALYASDAEVGYFNVVAFKSMAEKGKSTGGIQTYRLKPWSQALTDVINEMIEGDKSFYWDKVRARIEMDVMKKYGEDASSLQPGLDTEEEPASEDVGQLFDVESTEEKIEKETEERYQEKVNEHFTRTMIGCSWMNIYNADNSRAMANMTIPHPSHRSTLVILGREAAFNRDGETFPTPAMALAYGFDMVPAYSCLDAVDLTRYDTIIIGPSRAGVTGTMVRKINRWLREKGGLLVVNGNLHSEKALFPRLIGDPPAAEFQWEEDVTATPYERVEVRWKDRRGREKARMACPQMKAVTAEGRERTDEMSRVGWHYQGAIEPFAQREGDTILGVWQAPPEVEATVLFDGGTEAGPVYTEILEKAVLDLDQKRGASVKRNRWWGHVGIENERYVIDVASNGYKALQAARPRQHEGIDIIYGVVDPEVKHNTSTMILRDYVGPYAGGKGDWAVMARKELVEMECPSPDRVNLTTRGVVRVTHAGPGRIALEDTTGFEQVDSQLDVWKLMWDGQPAWSARRIDGGYELHYQSPRPVSVVVVD